jgi:hypothetical protein
MTASVPLETRRTISTIGKNSAIFFAIVVSMAVGAP